MRVCSSLTVRQLVHFARDLLVADLRVGVGNPVTGEGADHRTDRRSGFLAMAVADLVAQQGTRHAADHGAAVLALTADRLHFIDHLAGALLARNADALVLRLRAAHPRVVDIGFGVKRDRAGGEQGDKG